MGGHACNPGVLPREVAVLTGLILTFMGIGFAVGPMLVGVVAQLTGSIQTGLIVLSLLTGLGVIAGVAYPDRPGTQLGGRPTTQPTRTSS